MQCKIGTEGGIRTLTAVNGRRILSPLCLPIPPLRLYGGPCRYRTDDLAIMSRML